MASSFRVVQHIVNGCHTRDHIAATAHGDADTPKLSVKQYIPLDNTTQNPGDVTIIGAHANGFPKGSIAALPNTYFGAHGFGRKCMSHCGMRFTNVPRKLAYAYDQFR